MRTAIRRVHVAHGRFGYRIRVDDVKVWALVVSEGYERLMKMTGHPCCWRGIGRIPGVGKLAFDLLQATANIEWKHSVELLDHPVSEEEASRLWLGDWEEWLEWLYDGSGDYRNGVLWDAACGRCDLDFADGEVTAEAIEALRLHMDERQC